jgi:hypothetical protein
VREIRMLRAMRRVLETQLRKLLTGHEDGNVGYSQGVSCGLARQHSTLPGSTVRQDRSNPGSRWIASSIRTPGRLVVMRLFQSIATFFI